MFSSSCPEALYGEHGVANTNGNCPYCGAFLGRIGRPKRHQTRTDWSKTYARNLGADPSVDHDPDEEYWAH